MTARYDALTDLARAAICSIGSFDRGLQDHYQRKLDALRDSLGEQNEESR